MTSTVAERMTDSAIRPARNAKAVEQVKRNKAKRDATDLMNRAEFLDRRMLTTLTEFLMQQCVLRGIPLPLEDVLSLVEDGRTEP